MLKVVCIYYGEEVKEVWGVDIWKGAAIQGSLDMSTKDIVIFVNIHHNLP